MRAAAWRSGVPTQVRGLFRGSIPAASTFPANRTFPIGTMRGGHRSFSARRAASRSVVSSAGLRNSENGSLGSGCVSLVTKSASKMSIPV